MSTHSLTLQGMELFRAVFERNMEDVVSILRNQGKQLRDKVDRVRLSKYNAHGQSVSKIRYE